ncbi:MAG TPA: DUF2683 family protein [Candidatus Nanoarchaeia archaeon]|nr:DUF2683 family protein [Candidatus Nanoarchaeia archaeon]
MVQNIIDLDENEDRILNIVKAKYGLKNKSQAVAMLAKVYEDSFLEPELRPEYVEKLKNIRKEKGIKFRNINELRKIIGG